MAKEQVNGVQQKFLSMLIKSFGNRILALVIKNKKNKTMKAQSSNRGSTSKSKDEVGPFVENK